MDKLGIYIPTFNRENELKECLKSFIPQVKKYNLPIYISDNSTTHDTEKLVRMMKAKYYNRIYYRKNKYIRLGRTYALNLRSVFEMGNTEYVWFFGDDDKIAPGSIKEVLSCIKKGYSFIQINATGFDRELKYVKIPRQIKKYRNVKYDKYSYKKVMQNANANNALGYVGHMASIITKRELIAKEIKKIDFNSPYLDFIHIILFYNAIYKKTGILIAKPLIYSRGGNESLGNIRRAFEIWGISYNYALMHLKPGYLDKTLMKYLYMPFISNLFIITLAKEVGTITKEQILEYNKYLSINYNLNLLEKLILKVALYTPDNIVRFFYNLYKKIKLRYVEYNS